MAGAFISRWREKVLSMTNVTTLPHKGNPSPKQTIYEYFNDPLDRVEAQRAAWLDYRVRRRELAANPTLDNELRAVASRETWHATWRAANPS